MRLDCPACGKSNDLPGDATCVRCGCDLGMLAKLLQTALGHQMAAAEALRGRRWTEALHHAESSWTLHHSPTTARLAFLAAIALGDTPRALCWHQGVRSVSAAD